MKRAIFVFRRDLRIFDNTGFYNACKETEEVLPVFIFDENILKGLPKNDLRLNFIFSALEKLDKDLQKIGGKLITFHGKPEKIIEKLIEKEKIDAIFVNKAITRYGKKRDLKLKILCEEKWLDFFEYQDAFLVEPSLIPPKKIFSAFYRSWESCPKNLELKDITKIEIPKFINPEIETSLEQIKKEIGIEESNLNKLWPIDLAEKRLGLNVVNDCYRSLLDSRSSLEGQKYDFCKYPEIRDFPALDLTTKLSPYLRFGLISIRQVFKKIRDLKCDTEILEKELTWREFWYHITSYFPESFDLEFQEKRRGIPWNKNDEWLEKWKKGETGYPIVDAAMRQLNQEGWMHNRTRMIVASFLTKDLLIDWREGEKYFAEKLLDYEESVNIGNWQWGASTGADPRPMRIFSPIRQSERFDENANYIKKYIPELEKYPSEHLHNPIKFHLDYCPLLVDHSEMQRKAKKMYFEKILEI